MNTSDAKAKIVAVKEIGSVIFTIVNESNGKFVVLKNTNDCNHILLITRDKRKALNFFENSVKLFLELNS